MFEVAKFWGVDPFVVMARSIFAFDLYELQAERIQQMNGS